MAADEKTFRKIVAGLPEATVDDSKLPAFYAHRALDLVLYAGCATNPPKSIDATADSLAAARDLAASIAFTLKKLGDRAIGLKELEASRQRRDYEQLLGIEDAHGSAAGEEALEPVALSELATSMRSLLAALSVASKPN